MRVLLQGLAASGLLLTDTGAWATDHIVTVGANGADRFVPNDITIAVGDTVTFEAGFTEAPHNVSANDGSFRCSFGCDGSGGNGNPHPGPWSVTVSFDHAGDFAYRCDPHATMGMTGIVRVAEGSGGGGHVPITSGFTGAWYDPQQSGHGIFIEVLADNQILAWWFTFTPDGQQAWFGNVGTIDGDTATIAAVQTEGGRWIPNFDPSNVTQPAWGTLTFQFTDCNHGEVNFTSSVAGYGSGHMDLTRLTQPAGLACP